MAISKSLTTKMRVGPTHLIGTTTLIHIYRIQIITQGINPLLNTINPYGYRSNRAVRFPIQHLSYWANGLCQTPAPF